MVNVRKIATVLFAMMLIFAISTSVSFASGGVSSGSIDSVLILIEDGTIISISIDDYVNMFLFGEGTLYEFLSGESGQLEIYGIVSGDKYITIDNYVDAYITDPNTALEEADSIPASEVATFKEVGSVDEETGEVELVPIGGQTPTVDKLALIVLITESKEIEISDYSLETWAIFTKALQAAEAVVENAEATQVEVDNALEALELAIAGLEFGPNIEAKFKAFAYLDTNGHVIVQVYNVPNAMQYQVLYKMPDGRELSTTRVLIGSDKGAGPIYYNQTITINIFDANDNLVHTFKEVELLRDVQAYTNEINNYINNYLE